MLLKASESQQNDTFHRIVWPGLMSSARAESEDSDWPVALLQITVMFSCRLLFFSNYLNALITKIT